MNPQRQIPRYSGQEKDRMKTINSIFSYKYKNNI